MINNLIIPQPRVLVVDDASIVRLIHRKLFTDAGYFVDEACNGEEAVTMCDRDYAAIFMDINMPVMDGVAATIKIRLREQRKVKRTPIIGVSSYADKKEESLAAGMDDFVIKPIVAEQLAELAKKWIKN